MNEDQLRPLLELYGLLPESPQLVAKPKLSKSERAALAKVKRAYRNEIDTAKIMRVDVLNMTRHVDRRVIAKQMLEDGHREPAMLLTFNNEQLALLMAWRDAAQQTKSN